MDLIDKIFGQLTVIGEGEPIIRKNGKKRFTALCRCLCGQTVIVRKDALKCGDNVSCGCRINSKSIINLIGQKFGKLTVLELIQKKNSIKWLCICDCLNMITKTSSQLKNKNNSCGCNDVPKWKITAKTKYYHYKDGDISFENFIKLSQVNCYYCNASPKNTHVHTKSVKKEEYLFSFNGLDRLSNKLGHTIDNCITACWSCNRIKYVLDYEKFIDKITIIYNNFDTVKIDNSISLSFYQNKIMRYNYNDYLKRNRGDITFEDFSKYSLNNCFYCGCQPSNKRNYSNRNKKIIGTLLYSGLDRLDNLYPYNLDNVISSCGLCNLMKGTNDFNSFKSKIIEIYTNLSNKGIIVI